MYDNQFDEKYLMKIFCKENIDNEMKKLFEEIEIQEHLKRLYDNNSKVLLHLIHHCKWLISLALSYDEKC